MSSFLDRLLANQFYCDICRCFLCAYALNNKLGLVTGAGPAWVVRSVDDKHKFPLLTNMIEILLADILFCFILVISVRKRQIIPSALVIIQDYRVSQSVFSCITQHKESTSHASVTPALILHLDR